MEMAKKREKNKTNIISKEKESEELSNCQINKSEQIYVEKKADFGSFLAGKVRSLFRQEFRCDVELRFKDGSTLPAHGIVLDFFTDFFKKGVSADLYDLDSTVDRDAMERVLGYFYTGAIEVDDHNWRSVLKAAEAIDALELCAKIKEIKSRKRTFSATTSTTSTTTTTTSTEIKRIAPTTTDVFLKYKGHSVTAVNNRVQVIKSLFAKNPKMVNSDKPFMIKLLEKASNGEEKKVTVTVRPVTTVDGKKTFQIVEGGDNAAAEASKSAYSEIDPKGPFFCKPCKILTFKTYYDCRYHHARFHNLRFDPKSCDVCGFKSTKTVILYHHRLVKHGKVPPNGTNFPKCHKCPHVSLTSEAMKKHLETKHAVKEKSVNTEDQNGPDSTVLQDDEDQGNQDEDEDGVDDNEDDEFEDVESNNSSPHLTTTASMQTTPHFANEFQMFNLAVPVGGGIPSDASTSAVDPHHQQQNQFSMPMPSYILQPHHHHHHPQHHHQPSTAGPSSGGGLHQQPFEPLFGSPAAYLPPPTRCNEFCVLNHMDCHNYQQQGPTTTATSALMQQHQQLSNQYQQHHQDYMQQQQQPQQQHQQYGYWDGGNNPSSHHQQQFMYQISSPTTYASLHMPTSSSRSSPSSASSSTVGGGNSQQQQQQQQQQELLSTSTQTNDEAQNMLFDASTTTQ